MSQRIKSIFGIILLVASIVGIYSWESWGRQRLTTKQIIVLSTDVSANTLITEDMLTYSYRSMEHIIDNPVTDKNDIIGKMSKGFIASNSALSQYYFEEADLIPQEGEYIFQLPKSWIKSCPSTLRRSDDAYLYPILEKEERHENINDESEYMEEMEKMYSEGEGSEIFSKHLMDGETEDASENDSMEIKPIKCLKIAFVKNQSNQEVQSVGKQSRINGTSSVASVELIATFSDIQLLEDYRKKGYQFMILYQ